MENLCSRPMRRCVDTQAEESVVRARDMGFSEMTFYNSLILPVGLDSKKKRNFIYKLLKDIGYKDDEGVANEPGYEATDLMRWASISKKMGDDAFQQGDFRVAIDSYTMFIDAGTRFCPTVYARRSMCYVMSDMPREALSDAQQTGVLSGGLPMAQIASNLQSVALTELKRWRMKPSRT